MVSSLPSVYWIYALAIFTDLIEKSQIVQQYYKDIYGYAKPSPQNEFDAFNYIVKIYERLEQEKWEKEIDEAFDELEQEFNQAIDDLLDIL